MDFLAGCRCAAASLLAGRLGCFFVPEVSCMKVNRRIIFFFVALLLGGYVLVYEINGSSKRDRTGPEERIFYFNIKNLEQVEIIRKDQSVLFKKEGAKWGVIHPAIADKIDSDTIDQRLQGLLSVFDYGIVRVVDKGPSDVSQFGLDRPELLLSIKTKGEAKPKTLLIGDHNPTFTSCYAMVKGEPKVLLLGISYKVEIESEIKHFLSKPSRV